MKVRYRSIALEMHEAIMEAEALGRKIAMFYLSESEVKEYYNEEAIGGCTCNSSTLPTTMFYRGIPITVEEDDEVPF